jgi:hypothetical protein
MADIVFLDGHPGWTWQDLQDTPDDIVEGLKLLAAKRREAAT